MKNFILKYFEKIFAGICVFAFCLKLLHIPGSNILLIQFLSLLVFLYLPFGFFFLRDKETGKQNVLLSVLGGMVLAVAPIAVLFKLMHWHGANLLLLTGLFFSVPLLAVTVIVRQNALAELNSYYKSMLIRILIWMLLMVTLFYMKLPSKRFSTEEGAIRKGVYLFDTTNIENKRRYQEYLYSVDSLELLKRTY